MREVQGPASRQDETVYWASRKPKYQKGTRKEVHQPLVRDQRSRHTPTLTADLDVPRGSLSRPPDLRTRVPLSRVVPWCILPVAAYDFPVSVPFPRRPCQTSSVLPKDFLRLELPTSPVSSGKVFVCRGRVSYHSSLTFFSSNP